MALRRYKGDAVAIRALRQCFENEEERESIRCCAVVGLGCMGQWLLGDRLRQLYRERRDRQDDLLLGFAVHWAGRTAADPEVLHALLDLQAAERERRAATPQCETLISAAALRCARGCLARGTVTRSWLEERGCTELLAKLGETRIRKLIEAEHAREAQLTLSNVPEHTLDAPLVPGRALVDVHEEQYVQDLGEWRNVRIRETRSYVRDQFLSQQVKKDAGYTCQICGDRIENMGLARRFVHAHHVQPLSENGTDVGDNLVVVCPNCHARIHARTLVVEPREDGLYLLRDNDEPRRLVRGPTPRDATDPWEEMLCAQIIDLFSRLSPERQGQLVQELSKEK